MVQHKFKIYKDAESFASQLNKHLYTIFFKNEIWKYRLHFENFFSVCSQDVSMCNKAIKTDATVYIPVTFALQIITSPEMTWYPKHYQINKMKHIWYKPYATTKNLNASLISFLQ